MSRRDFPLRHIVHQLAGIGGSPRPSALVSANFGLCIIRFSVQCSDLVVRRDASDFGKLLRLRGSLGSVSAMSRPGLLDAQHGGMDHGGELWGAFVFP
jgi:hypothetical protein